jgi:hypothetical protein
LSAQDLFGEDIKRFRLLAWLQLGFDCQSQGRDTACLVLYPSEQDGLVFGHTRNMAWRRGKPKPGRSGPKIQTDRLPKFERGERRLDVIDRQR